MGPYSAGAISPTVRADGSRTTRSCPSRIRPPGRGTPRGTWHDAAGTRHRFGGLAPVRPEDRGWSREPHHPVRAPRVRRPQGEGPGPLRAAAVHGGACRSPPIAQALQPNVRPATTRRNSAAEDGTATCLMRRAPSFSSPPERIVAPQTHRRGRPASLADRSPRSSAVAGGQGLRGLRRAPQHHRRARRARRRASATRRRAAPSEGRCRGGGSSSCSARATGGRCGRRGPRDKGPGEARVRRRAPRPHPPRAGDARVATATAGSCHPAPMAARILAGPAPSPLRTRGGAPSPPPSPPSQPPRRAPRTLRRIRRMHPRSLAAHAPPRSAVIGERAMR
jgi:hypothetical protein